MNSWDLFWTRCSVCFEMEANDFFVILRDEKLTVFSMLKEHLMTVLQRCY